MSALKTAVDIDDNGVGNDMGDTVRSDGGVILANTMAVTAFLAGTESDDDGNKQ